jgi:hypothetical protein
VKREQNSTKNGRARVKQRLRRSLEYSWTGYMRISSDTWDQLEWFAVGRSTWLFGQVFWSFFGRKIREKNCANWCVGAGVFVSVQVRFSWHRTHSDHISSRSTSTSTSTYAYTSWSTSWSRSCS